MLRSRRLRFAVFATALPRCATVLLRALRTVAAFCVAVLPLAPLCAPPSLLSFPPLSPASLLCPAVLPSLGVPRAAVSLLAPVSFVALASPSPPPMRTLSSPSLRLRPSACTLPRLSSPSFWSVPGAVLVLLIVALWCSLSISCPCSLSPSSPSLCPPPLHLAPQCAR